MVGSLGSSSVRCSRCLLNRYGSWIDPERSLSSARLPYFILHAFDCAAGSNISCGHRSILFASRRAANCSGSALLVSPAQYSSALLPADNTWQLADLYIDHKHSGDRLGSLLCRVAVEKAQGYHAVHGKHSPVGDL